MHARLARSARHSGSTAEALCAQQPQETLRHLTLAHHHSRDRHARRLLQSDSSATPPRESCGRRQKESWEALL